MPIPKIALVPSSQGLKFLSVLPSNGEGDFTFTRSSSATRINSKGLIETVGSGISRLNYDLVGGCPSHLLEIESTNSVPYSEDFSQWTNVGGNTITSGFLAPDGTNNASKISGTGYVKYSNISNNTAVRSIYAKTVSGTGTAVLCSNNENTNNTFTITNEWQRFDLKGTTSISDVLDFYAVDFRGSGTLSEIVVFAAQNEGTEYVTSYIPTTGTSVTRAGESAYASGNTSIFNDSQGVLYLETKSNLNDTSARILSLSNSLGSEYIRIFYINDNTNINVLVEPAGVPKTISINIPASDTFFKIAVKYILNNVEIYINGALAGTIVDIAMPTNLATLELDAGGATHFYSSTKEIRYYDTVLSAAQLIELTTL